MRYLLFAISSKKLGGMKDCIFKSNKRIELKRFLDNSFYNEDVNNIPFPYRSFYFYDSKTDEIYDAVIEKHSNKRYFSNWLLKLENPPNEFSIIEKFIYNHDDHFYSHLLRCPNPDCSWMADKDSYLVKINAELHKKFIRDVNDYYKSEENDYPDNPPYLDVSSIKECPQCHIPFNGKVQIKKEF